MLAHLYFFSSLPLLLSLSDFLKLWKAVVQIVHYPHPTLRHQSQPVRRVDAELRKMVDEMFELMYEFKGIGLAANQVDLPLRLFVVNTTSKKGEGEELVFINPVLSKPKGNDEAEEGCLSLPGVYGQVRRPKEIQVNAYNLKGEEISATLTGLMSRVVQHETDHLDGVMFFDRMSDVAKNEMADDLEEFDLAFRQQLGTGEQPPEDAVLERLREVESRYC